MMNMIRESGEIIMRMVSAARLAPFAPSRTGIDAFALYRSAAFGDSTHAA